MATETMATETIQTTLRRLAAAGGAPMRCECGAPVEVRRGHPRHLVAHLCHRDPGYGVMVSRRTARYLDTLASE